MDGVFKLSSARFVRVHNRYKSIVINIEDNRFQLRHFKPGHNGINHFCVLVGIAAFPFEPWSFPGRGDAAANRKSPRIDLKR